MKTFTFRGFMAPVFTPFKDDEWRSLNLKVIPEYARFLKSNNVEGVLVNGTSGEATSQTIEEREKVAEEWMKAAKETQQTVMIQVGGTGLKDVGRLASHAEKIGASALLCLADLFHRPKTTDDILRYLQLVSRYAPQTPLLYYHLPDFTGINVDVADLLEKAYQTPNLVGIKFTSNDLEMACKCLSAASGKYVIFIGSDTMLLPAFSMGFDSVIGTTVNMMAKQNFDIHCAIKKSDLKTALKCQKKLTASIRCITKCGTWVPSMKYAMNLLTPIYVGPVREPLLSLSAKCENDIQQELKLQQKMADY